MTTLFGIPGLVWRRTASFVFVVVFILVFLFVGPMCACPWYYAELSLMGLVPLISGPRLYRWLGCGVIALGLMRAWMDHDTQVSQKQEIMRIRAEAARQAQHQ